MRSLLGILLIAAAALLAGCLPPRPPPDAPPPPMGGSPTAAPPAPALPPLDREPELAVLLASGAKVSCRLLAPMRHPQLGSLSGTVEATIDGDGMRINGVPVRGEAVALDGGAGGGPRFAAPGPRGERRYGGRPVFRYDRTRGQVQLGELVPLETYLLGVVGVEMTPTWPAAALRAQAVVARSFASDRWLRRHAQPWHLTASASRDMAYAGLPAAPQPAVAEAVRATRGEIIAWGGLPLPAVFHASSGGRTAGAGALDGSMSLADGRPAAAAFAGIPDEASDRGAGALGLAATHAAWNARIEASALLAAAAAVRGGSVPTGRLTGVEVEIDPLDERATAIVLAIAGPAGERRVAVPGPRLRLELGGDVLRSTWITRSSFRDGIWQVRGRGFGHGVGLSQVGAWQLAKDGADADAILRRYYPAATPERRW